MIDVRRLRWVLKYWLSTEVTVFSLCVLYRIYRGECSGELFDLYLPPNSLSAKYVTNLYNIHNILIRDTPLLCDVPRVPHDCGLTYLRQCFLVDTTWVPSKNASIFTLRPATHLWLICSGSWAAVMTYH